MPSNFFQHRKLWHFGLDLCCALLGTHVTWQSPPFWWYKRLVGFWKTRFTFFFFTNNNSHVLFTGFNISGSLPSSSQKLVCGCRNFICRNVSSFPSCRSSIVHWDIWYMLRLLALLVQQSLFYFYFEVPVFSKMSWHSWPNQLFWLVSH